MANNTINVNGFSGNVKALAQDVNNCVGQTFIVNRLSELKSLHNNTIKLGAEYSSAPHGIPSSITEGTAVACLRKPVHNQIPLDPAKMSKKKLDANQNEYKQITPALTHVVIPFPAQQRFLSLTNAPNCFVLDMRNTASVTVNKKDKTVFEEVQRECVAARAAYLPESS